MKKIIGVLVIAFVPMCGEAQDFKADFDKFRQGIMNDYNDFRGG